MVAVYDARTNKQDILVEIVPTTPPFETQSLDMGLSVIA
jgi:hypothetical protein